MSVSKIDRAILAASAASLLLGFIVGLGVSIYIETSLFGL